MFLTVFGVGSIDVKWNARRAEKIEVFSFLITVLPTKLCFRSDYGVDATKPGARHTTSDGNSSATGITYSAEIPVDDGLAAL